MCVQVPYVLSRNLEHLQCNLTKHQIPGIGNFSKISFDNYRISTKEYTRKNTLRFLIEMN